MADQTPVTTTANWPPISLYGDKPCTAADKDNEIDAFLSAFCTPRKWRMRDDVNAILTKLPVVKRGQVTVMGPGCGDASRLHPIIEIQYLEQEPTDKEVLVDWIKEQFPTCFRFFVLQRKQVFAPVYLH